MMAGSKQTDFFKNKGEYSPAQLSKPTSTTTTATEALPQPQSNGGPRVSFNRDVHVKRIGKHPYESTNYETTNLVYPLAAAYHQLPVDYSSAESIRKEAALVLAQAGKHYSKAENADNIPTFKVRTKRSDDSNPRKFNSLPTRKKRGPSLKPVLRSVSDAEKKKPAKRPSIFSIFNRRGDIELNQPSERDPRFEESGGRRLVRSKSDVGSSSRKRVEQRQPKGTLKESKIVKSNVPDFTQSGVQSTNGEESVKHLPNQLSPIIENTQKEDYFAEQFNSDRRKSDSITNREKHVSSVNEILPGSDATDSGERNTVVGKNRNIIKDKILLIEAKSNDNMHSSQLPPQKLPLTKGKTVNGLVKRLSQERFSPPPPISGPVFSYIRPNEGITYAHLDINRSEHPAVPLHLHRLPELERDRNISSPLSDFHSPERELYRKDFVTSQSNQRDKYSTTNNIGYSSAQNNRTEQSRHVPIDTRDPLIPVNGGTTMRISSSHSPSPWQQLSPRNLSDEDEGLGIETRKYYDDQFQRSRTKGSTEQPIVPVFRSTTPPPVPCESGFIDHVFHSSGEEEHMPDFADRRARLESRILTRRFGDSMTADESSPEHNRNVYEETAARHRYLRPQRFHKLDSAEIFNKYSPERTHLDIISLNATADNSDLNPEKTSRYKHTKYFGDKCGAMQDAYECPTYLNVADKSHARESRTRDRLGERSKYSPSGVITPGEHEPKSWDSQYATDQYPFSPDQHMKQRYEVGVPPCYQYQEGSKEYWNSRLKRDKLQQRSFDKGDSGIENDFRKESFNGDLTARWRKRTTFDDRKACDAFLKKERRHIGRHLAELAAEAARLENNHSNLVFRERSIDDGSHFDPHLDKYSVATSTLQRVNLHSPSKSELAMGAQKRPVKKLGGFEKVKQLFTGASSHTQSHIRSDSLKREKDKTMGKGKDKHIDRTVRATSSTITTTSSSASKERNRDKGDQAHDNTPDMTDTKDTYKDIDVYMVGEEEMRSRYREHRGIQQNADLRVPKITDIAMRRRLSTPKASPLLLKRTPSEKTTIKQSPLVAKPSKSSWFKSLDRRSKSKSKDKLSGQSELTSSVKRTKEKIRSAALQSMPAKNLRFFGDTDLDSNPPTISKKYTVPKNRPSLTSTLNRSQKYSQSAYHLNQINNQNQPSHDYRQLLSNKQNSRMRSLSMQNLDNGGADETDYWQRQQLSRSRDLDDISESDSETENKQHIPSSSIGKLTRSLSRERLDHRHRYDENTYPRNNGRERQATSMRSEHHQQQMKNLAGPPKPARSIDPRLHASRESDRYPAESSGTEGESSLHSQRSVVYLHATTIGAIPKPYHLRRRSISRDDLLSQKRQPHSLEPMTRTVSRSVSMLAPWKPKPINNGYEINYSQEQSKRMPTLPRKALQTKNNGDNASTLQTKKSVPRPHRYDYQKDDQFSLPNSSITSASKSVLSSNLHSRKLK